jgi:uncharacterized protein (TIGR02172 family)
MKKGQIIGIGRTAEILAWEDNKVLKLFRKAWTLSAVRWEEKIARIISEAAPLPAPRVHGIIEVKGRYGILYDNVEGPSMLKALESKPSELEHFANLFAELHARMHSVRVEDLPSQHQQIEKKILRAEPLPKNLRDGALKALRRLPDDDLLCHGDFHPDNIQMSKRGPIIIDWCDATRGTPEADIARTLLLISHGQPVYSLKFDPEELSSLRAQFVSIYLGRYKQLRSISTVELESWQLPVAAARLSEGIKEEEDQLLSIVKASLKKLKHVK